MFVKEAALTKVWEAGENDETAPRAMSFSHNPAYEYMYSLLQL